MEENHIVPNFIKLDIEGAEVLAFRGMRSILASERPVIYCAVHKDSILSMGEEVESIKKALLKSRYNLFRVMTNGDVLRITDEFENEDLRKFTFLALP